MNDIRHPRWERRKDARPSELLEAALQLFVERGYAATRLEDVAAKAGVSKGTLYLYFDSKEELFKAVVSGSILPGIIEAEAAIARSTAPTAELLRQLTLGWWEQMGASPAGGLPKLVMAEVGNFPELKRWYREQVIERGNRVYAAIIRRGIERGEFREVDVEYFVHVAIAPLVFLQIYRYSLGPCGPEDLDPARYLDAYVDLILAGLAKPAAPE